MLSVHNSLKQGSERFCFEAKLGEEIIGHFLLDEPQGADESNLTVIPAKLTGQLKRKSNLLIKNVLE